MEGDTEIIVGLDGAWADPVITDNPKVTIIHHSQSIGQRAITNECARLAKGKYLMKVDAHCSFDQGFDVKMIELMEDDMVMVPVMKNLQAFKWVCPDGHSRKQSPSGPCKECGKPTTMGVIWEPRRGVESTAYRFDKDMHFQYWNDFGKKQSGDLTETMSIQGSCFMCTKKMYFDLDLCSEEFHSWGQQGVEVACKAWLSGNRVVVNHTTWYAHLFRTQGGDFSFPYDNPQSKVDENREISKKLFMDNQWPKAVHKFQWLIDKFNPPGWGDVSKGIVFYTDNQLNLKIAHRVQRQLKSIPYPIVCASLKPMNFGDVNIHIPLERGYLAYFTQIVKALEASTADVVFMCEHDMLYHPSHFSFSPPSEDKFYYNRNFWRLRVEDGHCLHYEADQVSGLCAYRKLLLREYRSRLDEVQKKGYNRATGFEPGTHDGRSEYWHSEFPNVDIRHNKNLTKSRWSQGEFHNKDTCQGWVESE
jgi:hypothetical protein